MIELKRKVISQNESLPGILYAARKSKNLSLSQIALDLSVHPKYLRMLETGDYVDFPEAPYDYQIVKKYGDYLSQNSERLWTMYLAEKKICGQLGNNQKKKIDVLPTNSSLWNRITSLINFPRIIFNSIFAVIVLSIGMYFTWNFYYSFQPPKLEIISPQDNLITKERQIVIEGMTEPGIDISINGEMVLNDDSGYFSKEVKLHSGINMLKISASNKKKRENNLYRQIMVVEDLTLNVK
jgi:transcriptional regulator with XRE-family HTH domain